MSSLNPELHSVHLNHKVIASLGKVSEAFRVLLQSQAQLHGLSATQLQLLLFIKFHPDPLHRKGAFMAKEFNVTKATISDSVKALEQKGLVQRITDERDSRSFILSLTARGEEMANAAEHYTAPLHGAVSALPQERKAHVLYSIFDIVYELNQTGMMTTQRMCYNCRYYQGNRQHDHYCRLLKQVLTIDELRLECAEFAKPGY